MSTDQNPYSSPQEPSDEPQSSGCARSIGIALGTALCGVLLDVFVISMCLSPLWFQLGWDRPVNDWLISLGLGSIAGHWGMVWIYLPNWLIASLFGLAIGLCVPKRWFLASLIGGISFTFGSYPLLAVTNPSGFFLMTIPVVLAWRIPSVLLVVGTAFLSSRLVRERHHRTHTRAEADAP